MTLREPRTEVPDQGRVARLRRGFSHFACRWDHSSPDEPIRLYEEIDEQRMEVRKVEEFRDGRLIRTDTINDSNPSLSWEPVPPLADIDAPAEFAIEQLSGIGRPTIAVTVSVDQLRAGLPGHRPDQALIPAGTLRQMTCDADLMPIVLGSRSEVLDIGRSSRTIPAKIRRALIQRDHGCAFPGCDRPPGWTQAHHIVHWSKVGPTALFNLVHQ